MQRSAKPGTPRSNLLANLKLRNEWNNTGKLKRALLDDLTEERNDAARQAYEHFVKPEPSQPAARALPCAHTHWGRI